MINLADHINFEDYYRQYVLDGHLKGDELHGKCPFHDDHEASFSANIKTGLWTCYAGCEAPDGKGRNITTFHAKVRQISTQKAYAELAKKYVDPQNGLPDSSASVRKRISSSANEYNCGSHAGNPKFPKKAEDHGINPIVLEQYKNIPPEALEWLVRKRGWSPEIIEKYKIGFEKNRDPNLSRFTIPVWNEYNELVNVRRYGSKLKPKFLPYQDPKTKVWYGEPNRLYPWSSFKTESEYIVICEGEPDCLCGLSHGLNCVTQTGGVGWWNNSWNREFKGRRVIIAYDNDDPGRSGAEKNFKQLGLLAASVEVIQWPSWMQEKEDLTDWFMKYEKTVEDFFDLPRIKLESPSQQPSSDDIYSSKIAELNEKHAVIMVGGKCLIINEVVDPVFNRPDISFSSINDFRTWYANTKVPIFGDSRQRETSIAKIWLESSQRRQYQGIVFDPGNSHNGHYNLFRGFAIEPKKGSWPLFKRHILEVIAAGDLESFQYILSWMAQAVQNPGGERPGTSIVLRGKQGTGKGCFAQNFGALFGNHFVHITNQGQLTGHFNAHLKDALLVFCDEGIWAGDRTSEGVLKGMVTENTRLVEPKGKDPFPVKNYVRLIIASNNDWVIPAGLEERRFFVNDVSDEHIQSREYFGAILNEMMNGGREAMMYDFLEMDISGFDFSKFPRKEALFDQVVNTMPTEQKFWFERLWEGTLHSSHERWEEFVPTKMLHEEYLEFARNHGDRYPLIPSQFSRRMRNLTPDIKKVRRYTGNSSQREWCLSFGTIEMCRTQFESAIGIKINWDENSEEQSKNRWWENEKHPPY